MTGGSEQAQELTLPREGITSTHDVPDVGRDTGGTTEQGIGRRRQTSSGQFTGSRLLLSVLSVQAALVLGLTAWLHFPAPNAQGPAVFTAVLTAVAVGLILTAAWSLTRAFQAHGQERERNRVTSDLMETVLDTSQEWLWAVDAAGSFSFSSRASAALLGYEPSELVGQPVSLVLDDEDLSCARDAITGPLNDVNGWTAVTMSCVHRDGTPVLLEVAGRSRPSSNGLGLRFEGTSRLVPSGVTETHMEERTRKRISGIIKDGMILTAFQPIHDLASGDMAGVEALARFPSDDGRSPEHWFTEAVGIGLGRELEFAALAAALGKSARLPGHLYVSFNVSPETCLDPRLPGLLRRSGLALERVVLEVTERLAVTDYKQLLSSLEPLRRVGLRVAVDDAGSGFASMRHILQLRPDIIKLDRVLIAGIDRDHGQRALGAAMVWFAQQIGAQIIAEGIETPAELLTVTQIGMNSAQGYLLGRPTLYPSDWSGWHQERINEGMSAGED